MIVTLDLGDVFILIMLGLCLIYSIYVLIRIGIDAVVKKLKGEDYRDESK